MKGKQGGLKIAQKPGDLSSTSVTSKIKKYEKSKIRHSTRKIYEADTERFKIWGGSLPSTEEEICAYLALHAELLNPKTLERHLTSIRRWHETEGGLEYQDNPANSALVKSVIQGIKNEHGIPSASPKALLIKDLRQLVHHLDSVGDLRAKRDKALLLIGYFGVFRRSELANLKYEDCQFVEEGIEIALSKSKNINRGEVKYCPIHFAKDKQFCPVQALLAWQKESECYDGFIFRRLSPKKFNILDKAISPAHVNRTIKRIAEEAKLIGYKSISAHSLRHGCATEAARKGASIHTIQQLGRWESVKTASRYIEKGRLFEDSALKDLY